MLDVTKNTGRTPQDIMLAKSAEIGANIASQGTTRVIFDTAPAVAAGGMMRFFNQNRAFPATNFKDQFESGESLLITHLQFAWFDTGEEFYNRPFNVSNAFGKKAYFEIKVGNSRVIQQTKLDFLPTSPTTNDNSSVYWLPLESGLFIPPQVDFEVNLYLPDGSNEFAISCYIAGVGSLLNIKNY